MTDPFEEAVRAAGRGLANPQPAPTYHGSWKRGRRRRLAKRSAIAVAGACALVVAFGTDIGRFQGGTTIEVDDVASQGELVPAPLTPTFEPTSVPVATTEPVVVDPDAAPDLDLEESGQPAPTAAAAQPVPDDVADTDDAASSAAAPTTVATAGPTSAPQAETAAPTPVPQPEPTPSVAAATDAEPTPTAEASTFATPNDQDPGDQDPGDGDPSDSDPGNAGPAEAGAGEATTDGSGTEPSADDADTGGPAGDDAGGRGSDEGSGDSPQALPPVDPQASTRLGLPADARVVPDALANSATRKCDTDGDGVTDAMCELLPMYRCSGPDEVRADYQGIDLDRDGAIDTCVAEAQTTCDTTGDGFGDVSCRITADGGGEILDDEGP